MRKPKLLNTTRKSDVYAGIVNKTNPVYVGVVYFEYSAHINLSKYDVRRLGQWLINVADYLDSKKGDGK